MNDVKAIRVGDKIMVFVNGHKQVLSKGVSPETFDLVCKYISENNVDKIASIFDNVEEKLSEFLQGYFQVKNSAIYIKGERHNFSNLIIRKATELLSKTDNAKPLYEMANKTLLSSSQISEKASEFFKNVSKILLTENGNIILPTYLKLPCDGSVVGSPIKLSEYGARQRSENYSVSISSDNGTKEIESYVLINPFDIVAFNEFEVYVSRYKVVENFTETEEGFAKIENEFLLDLSYKIFEKKFSSKNS